MSTIKKYLKKSNYTKEVYYSANEKLLAFMIKVSPITASKYLYKRAIGKKLNLNKPEDFNEKLQWLKINWQHPLVVKCADKYEVREHVKKCGCEETLTELYGVYNNTSEINWNKLPKKFVLKTTNSCGTNIICNDKSKMNKNDVFRKLEKWLKIDYGLKYAEIHYSKMVPKIICEEYIETDAGLLPNDYKLYCFNGKPKLILVITERESGNHQRNFLDLNWKEMDLLKEKKDKQTPAMPKNYAQMISFAEKMAKGFPFVRIDFYSAGDRTIFGEMTFTPVGGFASYFNEDALKLLGNWIELPEKYTDLD
jgi:hypothetical protein